MLSHPFWYDRSCATSAHAVRANLFANATATTFGCRRLSNPSSHAGITLALAITARAPWISSVRKNGSPRLLKCPMRVLPPVPLCAGTNPRLAANSRPERQPRPSPNVAANAVAPSSPIPGTSLSTRALSSWHCCSSRHGLFAQIKAKTFNPVLYWTTIIAMTTFGTAFADFAGHTLDIGDAGGATLLAASPGRSTIQPLGCHQPHPPWPLRPSRHCRRLLGLVDCND